MDMNQFYREYLDAPVDRMGLAVRLHAFPVHSHLALVHVKVHHLVVMNVNECGHCALVKCDLHSLSFPPLYLMLLNPCVYVCVRVYADTFWLSCISVMLAWLPDMKLRLFVTGV